MIWYLLYPFRGTTEPPILDRKHPLRDFFTRYGYQAARHPVITLLVSVAAGAILVYPVFFLYTNDFTNGASNLPHHVWTAAQPFEGNTNTRPDVVMRSVWVHGSFMKALQSDVLQNALEIQDYLLGPTVNFSPRRPPEEVATVDLSQPYALEIRDHLHAINGLTNYSWFFHSPLQYWSSSSQSIADDRDIITTINRGSRQSTSVNVTLRHSIVFSGKRFEDHRLVAADALVITLVHMIDSPVGRQWERRAEELAMINSAKWRLYPGDGRSRASTLYEFRFQPLSIQDDVFLAIAYMFTGVYVMVTLSRLRALKSRLGLMVAVASQIAVSIMSSFTICAVLKIDLSKIPAEAYPVVILTVGLENIFRLVNAVILTPPESPTSTRMAEAVGQTGYIALAGVSQNLFILWLLSKVVSPGVSAFCTFAAVAITFDFFYLLTFFTAVLSVDVQRGELSDSLNGASARNHRARHRKSAPRQTWTNSILNRDGPASTRIAGTTVMTAFVLIAQWHFFDNESLFQTAWRFIHLVKSETQPPRQASTSLLSVDINQARTPTAWLKLQDHETAHEVIQVVKPNANSYIARVYDPLIFVLNGSDRTPNRSGVRPYLPAAYDFARNQLRPFLLTVAFVVAAVMLLMNYLLWDESTESEELRIPDEEPLLLIRTSSNGHSLDVNLLAASGDGVIVSVGLDRWISIWNLRSEACYTVRDIESQIDPFPVIAIAIDKNANWLALLSSKDQVFLWNIAAKQWGPVVDVVAGRRSPLCFFFTSRPNHNRDPLILVRHNGMITEIHMDEGKIQNFQICRGSLIAAQSLAERAYAKEASPLRIIATSRKSCVYVASQLEDGWTTQEVPVLGNIEENEINAILALPQLSSFLIVRTRAVNLVDIATSRITHTFTTQPIKPGSLQCFHSTRRRPQTSSIGLTSFAVAYTSTRTGCCVLQTYTPKFDGDSIAFRDLTTSSPGLGSETCCLWRETIEQTYIVENPGTWEALPVGYIVGVRICEPKSAAAATASTGLRSELRRRGIMTPPTFRRQNSQMSDHDRDVWEVWSLSARGEMATTPLFEKDSESYLLVRSLGPVEKVGNRSLAVGLGNLIKVITVGHERFDGRDEDGIGNEGLGLGLGVGVGGSYRWGKGGRRRRRGAAAVGNGTGLGARMKSFNSFDKTHDTS